MESVTEAPRRPRLSLEEWRAKREAKRQRQREQNVHRAAAMHEARLACVATDPADGAKPAAVPRLNIGCSGWFYWHWRGLFYPQDGSTSTWFAHYAKHFNTVELNAPFYSWPTVGVVNAWLKQIGRKRFTHTVKVSELITHQKKFVGTKTLVQDFYHIGHLLGSRLGCFLFQLPPSVHYSPAMLKRITAQLDPRWRNVVEFRHRSWWNETVYKTFRDHHIIFCSCSGPRLPDELIQTGDDIYLRFHGTQRWYRHDYTKEELSVWTERIKQANPARLWAYFNNDREGYAIKNARMLGRLLAGGSHEGTKVTKSGTKGNAGGKR